MKTERKASPVAGQDVERARHLGLLGRTEAPAVGDAQPTGMGPAHQARKQSLPVLCLPRPARVFPHLKGARTTGSTDPLPLVLIKHPLHLTLTPRGHTLPPTHLLPLCLVIATGKRGSKNKAGQSVHHSIGLLCSQICLFWPISPQR